MLRQGLIACVAAYFLYVLASKEGLDVQLILFVRRVEDPFC
jgi:hypothetical protein